MKNGLRVLLVEDVKTDAELIEMELEYSGLVFSLMRVETKDEFAVFLRDQSPDIILSDYSLPRFSAIEALRLRQELTPFVPFILVTGAQTEEIAVECIKKGADDYILKSSLTRLPTAISNAVKKKRAEHENAIALFKFKNLFDNSLVGMFRFSIHHSQFLEVNEKAKSILGVENVEQLDFNDFGLLGNSQILLSETRDKSMEDVEMLYTRPDNNKVWLSMSAKIYESDGIIEGVIHDITHTKNSFLELESTNYELDRFVYHASHDMRSPLRSLEGLLQVIEEENEIEEIRNLTRMMQRSTAKLDQLIEDLLILARNKKSEAKITSIDFESELKDALNQLVFLENYKRIKFEINVSQQCQFYSDAVRIRIILNNLISNAIKYHNFDQEGPFVQVRIQVNPVSAQIAVSDNGTGIDEDHIHKIFDMFYRATNSSEGSGLGLYLVNQTIEKLDGKITISSLLREGTTFVVEIPNMKIAEQVSPSESELINEDS